MRLLISLIISLIVKEYIILNQEIIISSFFFYLCMITTAISISASAIAKPIQNELSYHIQKQYVNAVLYQELYNGITLNLTSKNYPNDFQF